MDINQTISKLESIFDRISSTKKFNDLNIESIINDIKFISISFKFKHLYKLRQYSEHDEDESDNYKLLEDDEELSNQIILCNKLYIELHDLLLNFYIKDGSLAHFSDGMAIIENKLTEYFDENIYTSLNYRDTSLFDILIKIIDLCKTDTPLLYMACVNNEIKIKKINTNLNISEKTTERKINEYNDYFNENKKILEQLKLETNNLLAEAGEQTLIKNHLDQANKERLSANILRFFSILFLILSSSAAIYSLYLLHNNNTSLTEHLLRILSSLIISLPAIYLIKESNSHKKDERHYRDLGLDLAAIPSYLRGFDDETAKDLKKNLSNKLFAKQRDISSNTVPIDYQDLIKTVLQQAVNSSKDNKK